MNPLLWNTLVQMLAMQHEAHGTPPAPGPSAPQHQGQSSMPAPSAEGTPPVEVSLQPDDVRALGLRTERPQVQDFARTIRAVAVVSVDERRVAHVHTRFSGYIEKLHANFLGQKLSKGQPLVDIFSPDVLASQG